MSIQLTPQEFNYLVNGEFIPKNYQKIILSNTNHQLLLTIDDNYADEVREACLDHLPLVGFDETYEPNEEGKMLENLIDKFFTG